MWTLVQKREFKNDKCVESIDLGAPEEQSEIMKDNPSSPVKSVQCLSCDKKLVSNMALKMHMNLKHPVKAEIKDTEELLKEDMDEHKKEDSQDKLRNEVERLSSKDDGYYTGLVPPSNIGGECKGKVNTT